MPRQRHVLLSLAAVGLLALTSTSCSRFSSKNRHMRRADEYFASGTYVDAEIEYKNVLQADHLNPAAIARLGIIYYEEGSPRKALAFMLKAKELQPDNIELRAKLGQMMVELGNLKDAQTEAYFILGKNPADPVAPIILGTAATKPKEIEEARRYLTGLPVKAEDSAPELCGLGFLSARQARSNEAESLFRKALQVDPKSSAAYFGLGGLFWQRKDLPHAEEAFESAYKLAPPRSSVRMKYVQFKIQQGDAAAGRSMLEQMIKEMPDYGVALMMLAEMDVVQEKNSEAEALVDRVLQRDASNAEAMLLDAHIKLAAGEPKRAVTVLEHMIAIYPKYAPGHLLLGQAYLAAGDSNKSNASLTTAVTLNPNLTEGVLLLARSSIRRGDFKLAAASLTQLLQKHSDLLPAQMLLAEALRGQGDREGALDIYRRLGRSRPKDPEMALLAGKMQLLQNKRAEARASFSEAVAMSPTFLPAVEQLINMDLEEKNYPAALQRANSEIEKSPKSELPRLFLAKIYLAQGDMKNSEAALLKTIELTPDAPTAYFLLAQVYGATNRNDKALANLQEAVAKNPKALEAMMMIAIIYEGQKNYAGARDEYEKIIAVDPHFSSALNNLAYLYAEKFDMLEKGFEMAQRARELLPNEPHTGDTLGWIVFKKHQYPWALDLLKESAEKLPTEAEVQFHAGMAYYMMGQEDAAKSAFEQAMAIKGTFAGSEEAKQRLSILKIDVGSVPASDRPAVEKTLADKTDDPVALARLAQLHERDGALDKAESELKAAIALNSANVGMMLNLVHLYDLQHDTPKAFDLAKDIHKLAPSDPQVLHELGRLAYLTGDHQWAYSLLQEMVRSKPEDAVAQFDLANAAFSVGKVTEAVDAMHLSVQAGLSGTRADEAKRFTDMTTLIDNPSEAASEAPAIEKVLSSNPGFAPALMALAVADEAKPDAGAAVQNYEKLLVVDPDFVPAKRRLAILYSRDPNNDQKALDLAVKARETYPDDSELEKALGIVVYRKKDYERAAGLLQDAAQQRGSDAEIQFYLGMSRFQLKDAAASRKALQHALDLGLNADLATEARGTLAKLK